MSLAICGLGGNYENPGMSLRSSGLRLACHRQGLTGDPSYSKGPSRILMDARIKSGHDEFFPRRVSDRTSFCRLCR